MKLIKIYLVLLAILIVFSSCSKSDKSELSIEELNQINNAYSQFYNSFNEGIAQLDNNDAIKADIETRTTPKIEDFTNIEVYDIQGNAPDGRTIRDTVPYQRLMGHMDYYSYLEIIDGSGYLSAVIKIYDYKYSDPFRGILKVSKSLDEFFEQNNYALPYYLLDSTKNFVKSDNTSIVLNEENLNELNEQLKAISSLQEISGNIELNFQGIPTNFNYFIKNGIGIFS